MLPNSAGGNGDHPIKLEASDQVASYWMLKDGHVDTESQDAAACVMGGLVEDTAARGLNLVLLFRQGPRMGKKKGGERKGAMIVIAVRATSRSTFSGLNQPQRLKHFSLLGEKRGHICLPICGGQVFYFVRKNSVTFNSLKNGTCTMLFGLYPPSFLSFTTITFGLMTNP